MHSDEFLSELKKAQSAISAMAVQIGGEGLTGNPSYVELKEKVDYFITTCEHLSGQLKAKVVQQKYKSSRYP